MRIKKENINNDLHKYDEIYCVYLLIDESEIIYIGCSQNIYKRLKQHKYQKEFKHVDIIACNDERKARRIEHELIFKFKPKFNTFGKDKLIPEPRIRRTKYRPRTIEELKQIHTILTR